MSTEDTTPGEVRSSEGLGLLPERAGQPDVLEMKAEHGHWYSSAAGNWYSPAAVREKIAAAVAAERERCCKVLRDLWQEQEASHGNRAGEYHNGLTAGLDLAERRIRFEA